MSPKRKRIAAALLLVAFGAALVAWRLGGRERTAIERSNREALKNTLLSREETPAASKARVPLRVASSNTPGVFGPLPPLDAPLAQIYPKLVDEATRGNVRASCRLAYELNRCKWIPEREKSLPRIDAKIAQAANDADRERAEKGKANLQGTIQLSRDICAGFVDTAGVPAWEYLLNAALGGHAPSMARFALAPPMHPLNFTEDLEGWAAYRAYAPRFLQQAADAGYGPAVSTIAVEASGDLLFPSVHLGGVVLAPVDYPQSARYMYALSSIPASSAQSTRFRQAMLDKLGGVLTPAEMARAKAEGEALAATWKPEVYAPKEGRVPGQTLPKGGYDCNE